MIVNAKKLKALRVQRNWTQQQLANQCNLSLRTIQRVEKDGVASNDTVAAYSAVFGVHHCDFTLERTDLLHEESQRQEPNVAFKYAALGFVCGAIATSAVLLLINLW